MPINYINDIADNLFICLTSSDKYNVFGSDLSDIRETYF